MIIIAISHFIVEMEGYPQSYRQSIKHKAYQTRSSSHSRGLAQAIGDQTSKETIKRMEIKRSIPKKKG
jgi:23S rRNA maturation-related 3'-5' exoribonuclease YhaM